MHTSSKPSESITALGLGHLEQEIMLVLWRTPSDRLTQRQIAGALRHPRHPDRIGGTMSRLVGKGYVLCEPGPGQRRKTQNHFRAAQPLDAFLTQRLLDVVGYAPKPLDILARAVLQMEGRRP